MKLGLGGPATSGLPYFRTMGRPSLQNDHFSPVPPLSHDMNIAKFLDDASTETTDRPGTSFNMLTERHFYSTILE